MQLLSHQREQLNPLFHAHLGLGKDGEDGEDFDEEGGGTGDEGYYYYDDASGKESMSGKECNDEGGVTLKP